MSDSKQVLIYDCTLRDGTQGEGISLSLQDKLLLTQRMDEMGFDDVGQGMIVLRVAKPRRKRTLFIDPGKDQIDLR